MSLHGSYTNGCNEALRRFKLADMRPTMSVLHPSAPKSLPPPIPAASAHPAVSWADMHKGVANMQAANAVANTRVPPPAATSTVHAQSRFKLPLGRMLGLGALGTAGALAYGIHQQNQEDREKFPQVYAPMPGSFSG